MYLRGCACLYGVCTCVTQLLIGCNKLYWVIMLCLYNNQACYVISNHCLLPIAILCMLCYYYTTLLYLYYYYVINSLSPPPGFLLYYSNVVLLLWCSVVQCSYCGVVQCGYCTVVQCSVIACFITLKQYNVANRSKKQY